MRTCSATHSSGRMDDVNGGAGVLALPDDIQLDILRRLRAYSLARCRCVCTPWRDLVDARGGLLRLLRPHALPRAFPGFFANVRFAEPWKPGPAFLPPPASRAPAAVDRLAFLRPHLSSRGGEAVVVRDQCNGLVLCFQPGGGRSGEDAAAGLIVCNPTTERWARLPPPPKSWPSGHDGLFLAFDPAMSPHYEVFLLPVPPCRRQRNGDMNTSLHEVLGHVTLGMFVPESFGKQQEAEPKEEGEKMLPLLVYSSANGRWRRQLFAPGRHAPARLYDKVTRRRRRTGSDPDARARTWRSAVYRRGTLYALCEKRVLVVLRCSEEGTYDMVKLPADAAVANATGRYAAEHVLSNLPVDAIFSSTTDDEDVHGVLLRYASVDAFRVKVWALREPADDGQMSWTLTHDTDLAGHARMLPLLHDAPSNRAPPEEGSGGKCVWFPDEDAAGGDEGGRRWSWDEAGLLDMDVGEDDLLDACSPSPFAVLGCHPSREVVYLVSGAFHVVAYHLGSPAGKVRYLGRVVSLGDGDRLDGAFAYRPCIVDALPRYSCPFPSLKTVIKSH